MTRWYCKHCGIVRDYSCSIAPFCRHGDPELVAARMISIPPWHPLATFDGMVMAVHEAKPWMPRPAGQDLGP